MKRTLLTASLAMACLLAFAALDNTSSAQTQEPSTSSIQDLVGGTATVTTNPHGRGPIILEGTLLSSNADGIMVQTSKSRTWVPMHAILTVESP